MDKERVGNDNSESHWSKWICEKCSEPLTECECAFFRCASCGRLNNDCNCYGEKLNQLAEWVCLGCGAWVSGCVCKEKIEALNELPCHTL